MRILILGANGMLGHKLFLYFTRSGEIDVYGTVRNGDVLQKYLPAETKQKININVDANDLDSIAKTIARIRPEVVINCIGIIKQGVLGQNPLACIAINSLLPHKIARICQDTGARFLHISTDCVFSGKHGNYTESDLPDAEDIYGRSKLLGEVNYPNSLTLRTSIIGHELGTRLGLVEWFLAQQHKVPGYCKHIFSGFPTAELAGIIYHYIIPQSQINGIYHLSADPISKFELLSLIAKEYALNIQVEPDVVTTCDRSLDSSQLCSLIGYIPPSWPEMIAGMHQDYLATHYLRE